MVISEGATVTLEDSVLSRNTVSHAWPDNAIIDVYTTDYDYFLGDYYEEPVDYSSSWNQKPAILRLKNCTFSQNKAPYTLTSTGVSEDLNFDVQIYSDVQRPVHLPNFTSLGSTLPLEQAPSSRPGIDDKSPWFVDAQKVRIHSTFW